MSKVLLAIRNGSGKEQEAREEEGGTLRAGCVVKQMQSNGQPAKVAVPSEDGENLCRTDMEAPLSDLMSTRGVEVDKSKRWQQFGWGNNSKTGPVVAKGILGWDVELAVKRRPIVEGLEA